MKGARADDVRGGVMLREDEPRRAWRLVIVAGMAACLAAALAGVFGPAGGLLAEPSLFS